MSTAEHLSGADRAWLLMERPTNLMMILGLIILETRISPRRLRALVAARFLAFPRFRCFPVIDALGGRWVEAEQFDLDDHVSSVALPAAGGQTELEALVGELSSTPFNPGRPLWTFHLVERYGSGSAIIIRIHHAYADGIALVQVLLSLADGSGPRKPLQRRATLAEGLAELVPAPFAAALRTGADLVESGIGYLLHPAAATAAARDVLGYAGELVHITALADEPATHLKQPLSGARRAAWGDPLSLEEVRTIGHVFGCTVNDVLVAILAGALGRYLTAQGDDITATTRIRAAVPVNLRAADEPLTLGNRFGLVFVELPIGIRHPLERLYAVHTSMAEIKGSYQAGATLGLLTVVGTLPAAAEEPTTAIFSAKASLVISNLPGPREPLRLAGARIGRVLFWVPEAGSIGTGISALTYRDAVQFGVISDRQMIQHPRELIARVAEEFERLVCLTLLGASSLLK